MFSFAVFRDKACGDMNTQKSQQFRQTASAKFSRFFQIAKGMLVSHRLDLKARKLTLRAQALEKVKWGP